MYRFASIAQIAALGLMAQTARSTGNLELANFALALQRPQRVNPTGNKRHKDGRPKKRRNLVTVSRRVRRKHRRAA